MNIIRQGKWLVDADALDVTICEVCWEQGTYHPITWAELVGQALPWRCRCLEHQI